MRLKSLIIEIAIEGVKDEVGHKNEIEVKNGDRIKIQ